MSKRISVFILSSLLLAVTLMAQETTVKRAIQNEVAKNAAPSFFQGMALTVEVGSPLVHALGNDALNAEAGLRLNFKNKYFPIAELGFGKYDGKNNDTEIHYQTSAPYLRIGADINMLRDKLQENRLMVGARLGYTNHKFDVDGPEMKDPIWGNSKPLDYKDISSNRLWMEIVFGLESEILRHFHMGFSIRYRFKLNEKLPDVANPYYIPGFGHTDNGFKATYNIYFDLTKKVKIKNLD